MFLSWRTATATESNCGLISFRQGLSSARRILAIEQWEVLLFLAISSLWGHVKEEGGEMCDVAAVTFIIDVHMFLPSCHCRCSSASIV